MDLNSVTWNTFAKTVRNDTETQRTQWKQLYSIGTGPNEKSNKTRVAECNTVYRTGYTFGGRQNVKRMRAAVCAKCIPNIRNDRCLFDSLKKKDEGFNETYTALQLQIKQCDCVAL